MPTIPSYPLPDGDLDGSELLAGFSGGKTRRVTTSSIGNLVDERVQPMRADGSRTATAPLPMGGYRLTGLGDALDSGDAISRGLLANDAADIILVAAQERTRPLMTIASDHGYDATWDVQEAYAQGTWDGDDAALTTAMAGNRAVCINDAIRMLDMRYTCHGLQRGQRYVTLAGPQGIAHVRHPMHSGNTFEFGADTPLGGVADIVLDTIWCTQAGRISYGFPSQGGVARGALPGRLLKNDQAHIRIHGAQGGLVRNIGGWGAAHFLDVWGCNGLVVDQTFFFGGVWDNEFAAAQEAVSHTRLANGSVHGNNTSFTKLHAQDYGSAVAPQQRVVGGKPVITGFRVGPLYSVLINSLEDGYFHGGLYASASDSAFGLRPIDARSIIFNIVCLGVDFDESNRDCVSVFRASTATTTPDGLYLLACRLNGQAVAERAFTAYAGGADGASASVRRLVMASTAMRATLGNAMSLFGVDGGDLDVSAAGYNCVGSENTTESTGILLGGSTKRVDIARAVLGGGPNEYDANTGVDPVSGLTNGGPKYGVFRAQGTTEITAGRLIKRGFFRPGGALAFGWNEAAQSHVTGRGAFDSDGF